MEQTVIQVIATMMVFLTLSFKPVSSQVDITRTGCGKTKFCLAVPDDCDPAGSGTCLFGSVKPTAINIPNGVDMDFELSGNSSGYIAIGLIPNNSELLNVLFFSCGKNNSDSGSFFFRSSIANIANQSSITEEEELMETTVTGKSIDGVNIKCMFTVAKVNASKISSTRTTDNITYSVIIWSGNVENGKLASFTPGNQSMPIDLATFLSNSPTNSPTTSSTTSPTKSPTTSSTTSPTNSPTTSSTTSPTKSPTTSSTTSPTKSPTTSSTTSPTKSPTTSSTTSPTKSPTTSSTTSPTKSPTTSSTTSPTKSPTTSSTTSPTNSPTTSSKTSPTNSPTNSSTTSPTNSPTNSTAAPNGANRPVFSNALLPLLSFLTLSLLKFA